MSKDVESLNAEEIAAQLGELDADQLAAIVARANEEYWEHNEPSLPDTLYDQVVEALRSLRPDAPILQELGEKVTGEAMSAHEALSVEPIKRLGSAVRHRRSMLSLDKCYTDEDLMSWAKKFEGEVMVMPKMDSIACSLRYNTSGELIVAATRGSGSEGEDITVNVMDIPDVPNRVDFGERALVDDELEIRGEIYMRLSVFREHFAAEYSNPRNLTAGAIKHKERTNTKRHHLSFFAYDLDGFDLYDEREKLEELRRMGFPCDYCNIVARDTLAQQYQACTHCEPFSHSLMLAL